MEVIEGRVELEPQLNVATWLVDGESTRAEAGPAGEGDHIGPDRRARATFLLVHGLASNSQLWNFMALELASRGHKVAATDLRGHGISDKPDHGYDFSTLTSDIVKVSAALGLSKPILAGQSLGANLVLEAAFRNPELFRGTVCVDGGTIELSEPFPEWEDAKKMLTPPKLEGTESSAMIRMMREAHPSWPESGIQATMANFVIRDDGTVAPRLSLDNHLRILRSLWEHKPSTRFAGLQVPALFVFAGGSGSGPPGKRESAKAAEAAVPSVIVEWFDDADHDIHAQHPVELAALLDLQVQRGFFAHDQALRAPD
jgi:pimeloyl-ACP methyl ester carboxylesterase